MKRLILVSLTLALVAACGGDDNNTSNNNGTTDNNGTTGTNNGTAGSNNGTAGSNNGTTGANNGTAGSNNGTAGSNNGTTGTNNGTTGSNNGTTGTNNNTNSNPGAITVRSTISPNQGPLGTEVTHQFDELTNFTLDPDNIGGANMDGFGHYHIYVDVVDADHQLLESGMDPDTFNVEIALEDLAPGAHNLIVKVHKNDHSEYSTPIEYSIPFTITE